MRNLASFRAVPGRAVLRRAVAGRAVLGVLVALGVASPAAAQPADVLVGSYDVKFEQVSTNCEHPVAYPLHGSLKIESKGGDFHFNIDRTPIMIGKRVPPGKVSAKSPKPGHTPIEGMDGVFSIAGRITAEGMLSLVMVGEYQTAGKPLCTQSWNLSGLRSDRSKK